MRENNKLKIKVVRSKGVLLPVAGALLLAVLTCAAIYGAVRTQDAAGIERMVREYITGQVEEGGFRELDKKQMDEIAETVAVTLQERAAEGLVGGEELAQIKLLLEKELLEKNQYLTGEDTKALLENFEKWAKDDYMSYVNNLLQGQEQLAGRLDAADEALTQKAGKGEVGTLQETDKTLRLEDERLWQDNEKLWQEAEKSRREDEKLRQGDESLAEETDRLRQSDTALLEKMEQEQKKNAQSASEAREAIEQKLSAMRDDLLLLLAELEEKLAQEGERITGHETQILSLEERQSAAEVAIATLAARMEACFRLVSSAREMLASTLTDKGVATEKDASFDVINNQILKLYMKAFAEGADSVNGKNAQVLYEYHHHVGEGNNETGDENNSLVLNEAAGCYTQALYHVHQVSCVSRCNRQGEYLHGGKEGNYYRWYYRCPVHGEFMQQAFHKDDGSSGRCTWVGAVCGMDGRIEGYGAGCGMVEGQILSATVLFDTKNNNSAQKELRAAPPPQEEYAAEENGKTQSGEEEGTPTEEPGETSGKETDAGSQEPAAKPYIE